MYVVSRAGTGWRPISALIGPNASATEVFSAAVPNESPIAEQLVDVLAGVRRALRRLDGRPAELVTLRNAEAELTRLVRRRPGVSVTDAAAELGIAPNTVSTLVRRLTDAGIVDRTVDENDRRVGRLDLAPDVRERCRTWRGTQRK